MTLWVKNLIPTIQEITTPVVKQLLQVNILWKQPRLLRLPKQYDDIFAFYHKRPCKSCRTVPRDPTLCLLCGQMVCLRQDCCKVNT